MAEKKGRLDGQADTGVFRLDVILGGGFERNRVFLIEGSPGAGKTTAALSFLLAGAARGERCLYISLCETEMELHDSAASHGWSLDSLDIFELVPPATRARPRRRRRPAPSRARWCCWSTTMRRSAR